MYGLLIKLHNTRNRKQNQFNLVINEKSIIQLTPVIKFMLKAMDFYILKNMYKNLGSTCGQLKRTMIFYDDSNCKKHCTDSNLV